MSLLCEIIDMHTHVDEFNWLLTSYFLLLRRIEILHNMCAILLNAMRNDTARIERRNLSNKRVDMSKAFYQGSTSYTHFEAEKRFVLQNLFSIRKYNRYFVAKSSILGHEAANCCQKINYFKYYFKIIYCSTLRNI